MFITGLVNILTDYELYRYIVPFDDANIYKTLSPAKIPAEKFVVGGFPIRQEFFTKKNVKTLKNDFGVPLTKPVVTVLMGVQGQHQPTIMLKPFLVAGTLCILLFVLAAMNLCVKKLKELGCRTT